MVLTTARIEGVMGYKNHGAKGNKRGLMVRSGTERDMRLSPMNTRSNRSSPPSVCKRVPRYYFRTGGVSMQIITVR
jgi:hypothetical protein